MARIKQKNERLEPWQDPHADPYLEIVDLEKTYEGYSAVNELCLDIYKGEFFSLLGPSGCGKSTLLRMLAGLEKPTSGKILLDGVDITNVPAHKRPVNMMFQSYALFPHMTVYQNIAFGLEMENMPRREIDERVNEALNLVRLYPYRDRKPAQLSGGQRQRVALVRSLVKHPKLILLDEPLGALDKNLREQTQFELVNIQEKVGITFVMVTHDQEEAMTMSTRMGIMDQGRIRQVGQPHEIYEYPNSQYVAEFIGSVNIFEGIAIEADDDHILIETSESDFPIRVTNTSSTVLGAGIRVALRPEKISLSSTPPKNPKENYLKGIIKEIAYLGDISIYYVQLPSGMTVRAAQQNLIRLHEQVFQWDDEVHLTWQPEKGVLING